jgi:hypothetical protein
MILGRDDPRRDVEMKEMCGRKISRLEIQSSMIRMHVNQFGSEISGSDSTELMAIWHYSWESGSYVEKQATFLLTRPADGGLNGS